MSRALFSPHWSRVAALRPRLRPQLTLTRQRLRGQTWYVLQDRQSGRHHRLSPTAQRILGLMNGRRTVDEIWRLVLSPDPHDDIDTPGAPGAAAEPPATQQEMIQPLAQLHMADLLLGDPPPDLDELARRGETQRRRELMQRLRNPLALRLPLIDPDGFLSATVPLVRPLFTTLGLVVWLALVAVGGTLAVLNWPELTRNLSDRVLSSESLLLLALIYPIIKTVHELGHGYAVKVWGGEVREMGIMFLIFIPVPYVDASAASDFRSTGQRVVVGGAGVMVELALAAMARIVWVLAEPGLVRAAAYNVALIGGVSTLLFNGNPLLRFDGYYVMADWLQIPNLATRANKHFFHVIERYAFGVKTSTSPAHAPGERTWFFLYAVLAFCYRIFITITITIAAFIASEYFFIGVALAILSVATSMVWPLLKGVRFLAVSPRLDLRRRRAVAVTGAAVAALLAGLFAWPVPLATLAEGVAVAPETALVRATTGGEIAQVLAAHGDPVTAGQPLVVLRDGDLDTEMRLALAQLAEIRARFQATPLEERTERDILRQQAERVAAELERLGQRHAALVVRAGQAGTMVLADAQDLAGRIVTQGTLLGLIDDAAPPLIRAVIAEDDIDLVLSRLEGVSVRLPQAAETTLGAAVERLAPAASTTLVSPVLGHQGGGPVAVRPDQPETTLSPWYLMDVRLAERADAAALRPAIGGRAWVRFDHGREALAWRGWRFLRRQFLRQFDV